MKIFISWSGERGKAVATALHQWLPLVLHYAQPWLSDRDIAAGSRWAADLGQSLEGCSFGIIVLTPESVTAPWILFEAGALSKAFTASGVCPLLIDVDFQQLTDSPLGQFQAKKLERASLLDMVLAINARAIQQDDVARLRKLFDLLWGDLEQQLAKVPNARPKPATRRPEGQVLEDLVVAVRSMESVVRELTLVRPDPSLRQGVPRRLAQASGRVLARFIGPFSVDDVSEREPFWVDGHDGFRSLAIMANLELEEYGKTWVLVNNFSKEVYSLDERTKPFRDASFGKGAVVLTLIRPSDLHKIMPTPAPPSPPPSLESSDEPSSGSVV